MLRGKAPAQSDERSQTKTNWKTMLSIGFAETITELSRIRGSTPFQRYVIAKVKALNQTITGQKVLQNLLWPDIDNNCS